MHWIRELRRAARTLARTPGFALASILILATGIAAVTTVFGLVHSVLLEPLPFPEADRLVSIRHTTPGLGVPEVGVSEGAYLHYAANARSLERVGTYYESVVNLSAGAGDAERVAVALVTHSFFETLGAHTVLGRLPTAADADGSGEVVVLLSHALWTRRYGADPRIIGRTIEANRVSRRVIGVLEPGFRFPRPDIGLWYPSDPDPAVADAADFYQHAAARLAPGSSVEEAQAEMEALLSTLPAAYPSLTPELVREARIRPVVRLLKDEIVGEARAPLWLLLGGMALLLLIACANVAGLVVVRAEHRQREVAVRTALGAGRADLARLFVAESLVIGMAAGGLALVMAMWGMHLIVIHGPADMPRLHEVGVDASVAAFAFALALLTGTAFGAVPLAGSSRAPDPALFRSREAAAGRRTRSVLVGAQIALALALLVCSALLARSLWRLAHTDPGFDADGVLTAGIAMPFTGYETYDDAYRLWDALLERVGALPGVQAAGTITYVPLAPRAAFHDVAIEVEGRPADARVALPVFHATPRYLETMRIPIIAGRGIEEGAPLATSSVVLSAAAARALFPSDDPVGRRIRRAETGDPWMTVAGVAGDVPESAVGGDPLPAVYVPVLREQPIPGLTPRYGTLVVRTADAPLALAPAIRAIVRELDPDLPLAGIQTMDRIVAGSMARTSFVLALMAIAGVAALLLGAVGLYGVVAYTVARRTREIGIRMALGATARDVRRLILRDGLRTAFAGVAIGSIATLALARILRALLFEVSPADPMSYIASALLIGIVAFMAGYLSARGATRIQPMAALRAE